MTENNINESLFSDVVSRGEGRSVRKEDELEPDEQNTVNRYVKNYAAGIVYYDYENSLDGFKNYMDNSWHYYRHSNKKVDNYVTPEVERNWDHSKNYQKLLNDTIKEWNDFLKEKKFKRVPGETISVTLDKWWMECYDKRDVLEWLGYEDLGYNCSEEDMTEIWDNLGWEDKVKAYIEDMYYGDDSQLEECDAVAPNGGLVLGDVQGMGPITFPGECGEKGSGDLPMPSGVVYQQVAPFTTFLKMKKSKKKKKKFRKEDEPCVHSDNPPMYNYVDDFRDYVDRTYNKIK